MFEFKIWKESPIGGFSNINGNYYCKCTNCDIHYIGDKYSWQCYPCAVKSTEERIENNKGEMI